MGFKLGKTSLARLQGVDETLVNVVKRAIEISEVDFTVMEGVRTLERQRELYAQGRTAPGMIVTWTMKSRHIEARQLTWFRIRWIGMTLISSTKSRTQCSRLLRSLDVS